MGVLGLGVDPHGLILADNFGGIRYTDPIEAANKYAAVLRHDEKCDFVIALSHLGFATGNVSDSLVAVNSTDIDLIVGGHTHAVRGVFTLPNRNGRPITVMQTRKSGKEIDQVVIAY